MDETATTSPGLRIGEVARRAGVTTATLRAWEARYGLLPAARTAGGQRLYGEADVGRVQAVRRLVSRGWSVAGAVSQVLSQPGQGLGQADQVLSQPGQVLSQPGQVLSQPGQALGQPGQGPGQPGQGPGQPGQGPGQPGQGPGQPERSAEALGEPSGDASGQEGRGAAPAPGVLLPGGSRRPVLDALAGIDAYAVLATYETARDLLRATDAGQVRDILAALVRRLGGEVGEAALQDDTVMPVDLAFGEGPPLLPRAPSPSVARMRLEAVLPFVIEDARTVVHRLQLSAPPDTPGQAGAKML